MLKHFLMKLSKQSQLTRQTRWEDRDNFADRIDIALSDKESLEGELIRVNRASKQQN